jgi:hypothetical protein
MIQTHARFVLLIQIASEQQTALGVQVRGVIRGNERMSLDMLCLVMSRYVELFTEQFPRRCSLFRYLLGDARAPGNFDSILYELRL